VYARDVPRLIDHEARELEIAEAAWRVLTRDGIRNLSVRTVAAEAGLATASLRRAFPTHNALFAYSLQCVQKRVNQRIAATPPGPTLRDTVEAAILQLLPLDDERRLEMEVFLVIGSMALSDEGLRPVYKEANEAMATGCGNVIDLLVHGGEASPELNAPLEARKLHAIIDGLALHLLRQSADEPTMWAIEVLRSHLESLKNPV
jgi:AcrR family transcriptional regulator